MYIVPSIYTQSRRMDMLRSNSFCQKQGWLPIKHQTTPRLEQLGATISARFVCSLLTSLPREIKQTFWVYSTTVILLDKTRGALVTIYSSHTLEVQQPVPEAAWNYCPGAKNPAGLLVVANLDNVWKPHCGGMDQNF